MNVEIAERLAARRKLAGLSQEALAEKLGVSRQAVSKWERSESSPDTDNLIALAKLYGVSLDELLYVDESIEDDVPSRPPTGQRRELAPTAFTWTTARTMCTCPGPRACTWSTATARRCTSAGTACASTRQTRMRPTTSSRVTTFRGIAR